MRYLHAFLTMLFTMMFIGCGSESLPDVSKYLNQGNNGSGNSTGDPTDPVNPTDPTDPVNPTDPTDPITDPQLGEFKVTGLAFLGESWRAAPWRLIEGSGEQLKAMHFSNIDSIQVMINAPFTGVDKLNKSFFKVEGKNTGVVDIELVSINLDKSIVTIKLANTLSADWYTLTVSDSFQLVSGLRLDGDWTNPRNFSSGAGSSTFPSGDHVEGGDFEFLFGVLPGNTVADDEETNRSVEQVDITKLNNYILTEEPYTIELDINGDGVLDSKDLDEVVSSSRANLQLDELP